MIKFTIAASCVLNLCMAFAFFADGAATGGVICLLFAFINVCYYYCVRRRIPFAAANLDAACKSVQAHWGSVVVAYFCMVLQFVWILVFSLAFFSVVKMLGSKQSQRNPECTSSSSSDPDECPPDMSGGIYFLMLVSFYW